MDNLEQLTINSEKIINLLTDLLKQSELQAKELSDLKNLFLRYDLEMQAEQMDEIPEE